MHLGEQPYADALEWVTWLADRGVGIAYITNNPHDPTARIEARLERMGFPMVGRGFPRTSFPVLTSALAAAHRMLELTAPGAPVLCVGAEGLKQALRTAGLAPVASMADGPRGVVVGGTPAWDYGIITEAVRAVRSGLPFVVTNHDPIFPSTDGARPGTGALVAAIETAGERRGEAVGKPAPYLFRVAAAAFPAARQPIMVGDRLDTDVAGAQGAGWAAIWLNRAGAPGQRITVSAPDPVEVPGSAPTPYYELPDLDCRRWRS